jgi:hypothetical protein
MILALSIKLDSFALRRTLSWKGEFRVREDFSSSLFWLLIRPSNLRRPFAARRLPSSVHDGIPDWPAIG